MNPPKTVRMDTALGAYFEMVELGQDMMISGLIDEGLTPTEARREYARLHKERFARGDSPGLIDRAMRAGIWGREA